MYREEVIAKALRELRDKLKNSLDANKARQRELVELRAEHELAMRTLSSLVRTKQTPATAPSPPSVHQAQPPQPAAQPQPRPVAVAAATDRKAFSREKLKTIAYPLIQARFRDESFEVSTIRELLDEMEPEVTHSYEAAWNLCNDLLREGKLKPAGIKHLEKGVARLFKLKTPGSSSQSPGEKAAPAGG